MLGSVAELFPCKILGRLQRINLVKSWVFYCSFSISYFLYFLCSLFSFRLTDLGSMTLNNIFGVQDTETLDNLLHNVPNIVPRKDSLQSSGEGAASCLPLGLQTRPDRPSCLEPIKEADQTQVEVSSSNGRSTSNRASDGSAESEGSQKSSSKLPESGSRAEDMECYINPCLVNDSPSLPAAPPLTLPVGEESASEHEDCTKSSAFVGDVEPSERMAGGRESSEDSSAVDNQNGINPLSPAVSELSLNQGSTLQTFLRNLAEKNVDTASELKADGKTESSDNLIALDLHYRVSFSLSILQFMLYLYEIPTPR